MKEYKYTINGNKYNVTIGEMKDNNILVTVNGEDYNVEIEQKNILKQRAKTNSAILPPTQNKTLQTTNKKTEGEALKSPLPGVINDVCVKVGDIVEIGQTIVVLEAMKMANNLDAEINGTITEILVQPGQTVMENTPLVIIS